MKLSPNTVMIPADSPFNLATIIRVAKQNTIDASLIDLIRSTFEQPEIKRLVSERNLPMPDAIIKSSVGISLEWHIKGIACEITFVQFGNSQQVNPGTYEISTGAYIKPMLDLGEKGVIEIINRVVPVVLSVEKTPAIRANKRAREISEQFKGFAALYIKRGDGDGEFIASSNLDCEYKPETELTPLDFLLVQVKTLADVGIETCIMHFEKQENISLLLNDYDDCGHIQFCKDFWDCECKDNYIHPATVHHSAVCPVCGAEECEQPDARINEIFRLVDFFEKVE